MNEMQRQLYLSALGLETYMPRWRLPFAPASVLCELPEAVIAHEIQQNSSSLFSVVENNSPISLPVLTTAKITSMSPIDNLIGDMFVSKKTTQLEDSANTPINILPQQKTDLIIEGFSLSIWRPMNDLMIIDSRNTTLALPTERLLANILKFFYPEQKILPKEDVLRWPMIENSFTKSTMDDARTELQTWMSVQYEIKPIKYLWLMGNIAAVYFLARDTQRLNYLWQSATLTSAPIKALILPSLNELLQKPMSKQKLFNAIKKYDSTL